MVLLLTKIKDTWDFIFYDLQDERTRDMFPGIWFLIFLLTSYLYFIKNLGPSLMKNKRPFELTTIIFYYNIFQIIICTYLIYLGSIGGWLNGYSYTCQPVDTTENPRSRTMLNAVWLYTVVKMIDLMDTVFFVLKKKGRQISFLHVYHHFGMPIITYIALKYYPNGHGIFLGYVNCFVHIIMYTYYLIAGMGPQYQKYLWWKKYVTVLQIIQFVAIFIHNAVPLCNSQCEYPKWISVTLCLFSLQFIYMFGSFYFKNYVKTQKIIVNGSNAKMLKAQ